MKKQDIAGIIVYVIILALAAVFGLVVVREYSSRSNMETWQFILFIAGAIITGIIFNSILYELAHMLGAKMGGYKITSVAILGIVFSKEGQKTKVHFGSYDGLTGETKIIPIKDRKKPSNPIPYLIMGTAIYAIEVVAVVLVFSILTRDGSTTAMNNIAYFLLVILAAGGIIIFYNIIPIQLDSMTDGYRLRLVSGKKNKDAFNKMLLGETVENENQQEEKISSFSSDLKMNQVLTLMNEDNFIEAEKLINEIVESSETDKKISHKTLFEAKAQKIFLTFMNNDFDAASKLLEENLSLHEKKQISEESSLPFLRAYILISGLLDRSRSECVRALDKVYKSYKRTPESRRNLEIKLFNKSLNLVIEKHPDWNLEAYLINTDN